MPIHHQEYRPVKRVANLLESRQVNLGSLEMMDPSYIEAILSLRVTPGRSYVNPWRDLSECGDNIGENIYNILREPRDDSFITDCIAGGLNFESTDIFIKEVFSL